MSAWTTFPSRDSAKLNTSLTYQSAEGLVSEVRSKGSPTWPTHPNSSPAQQPCCTMLTRSSKESYLIIN